MPRISSESCAQSACPTGCRPSGYGEADCARLADGAWPQQRLLQNAPIEIETAALAPDVRGRSRLLVNRVSPRSPRPAPPSWRGGGHALAPNQQPAGDRIDPDVADHEQVGVGVVDQIDEHVDRGPGDRALFDVLRARGPARLAASRSMPYTGALPSVL